MIAARDACASTSTFTVPSEQLQQLQHIGHNAHVEDVGRRRIVLVAVALSGEQNLLVAAHHLLERPHRLFAADKQRLSSTPSGNTTMSRSGSTGRVLISDIT